MGQAKGFACMILFSPPNHSKGTVPSLLMREQTQRS